MCYNPFIRNIAFSERGIIMGMDQYLRYGDVIRVNRGIYYHYGIYESDSSVYQYAADEGSEIDGSASVNITDIDSFARGGTVQKLEFSSLFVSDKITVRENENKTVRFRSAGEYLACFRQVCKALSLDPFELVRVLRSIRSDYKLYTPQETVARAESRLGETSYNLALNNCESYAMWCKTGVNISYQTMSALFLLGPLFPELALSRYAMAAYSLFALNIRTLPHATSNMAARNIAYLKDLFPPKDNE